MPIHTATCWQKYDVNIFDMYLPLFLLLYEGAPKITRIALHWVGFSPARCHLSWWSSCSFEFFPHWLLGVFINKDLEKRFGSFSKVFTEQKHNATISKSSDKIFPNWAASFFKHFFNGTVFKHNWPNFFDLFIHLGS